MRIFALRLVTGILTFAIGLSAVAWIGRRVPPAGGGYDPVANAPALEMVFVLDTTGSMGGLIEGAKQRIWGIVNEAMQAESRPSVRIGLVAYRDRGDAYVTEVLPLTNDLDKVYATLMQYRAEGGGDTPEDVRSALAEGVSKAGWSQAKKGIAQILFLVGDAPPHNEYRDVPDVSASAAKAINRGIIVNTIQCGADDDTARVWQEIARRGEGQYFAIAQNGGVEAIASPFDAKLGELGGRLGATFTAYGGGSGEAGLNFRREMAARQSAYESSVAGAAPAPASADRAVNKAISRDAYVGDLLQDIESGRKKLEDVKADDLPDNLKSLSAEQRKNEIERRLEERRKLREEILNLSKQRDEFIAAERRKRDGGPAGFDSAVSQALKEQMARRGIK